jgi:hypothetical protein
MHESRYQTRAFGREFTESDGAMVVDLPRLEEGDVLLLH